jgi:ABC-type spermidine/putrescine transport system permease subunit II
MIFSVVLGTAASIAIARNGFAWVKAGDLLFMSPLLLPALPFGFAALVYINKLGRVGKRRALRAAPTQIAAAMACFPLLTLRGAN